MPTEQLTRVVHCLRQAALRYDAGGLTDGQLLECFVTRREEAAFAALVRRHGAMVLGVCRRIVGNIHDADDAFQATFLVLVRRAAAVVPREAVGNWLYGVAYRTALEARAKNARRRAHERQVRDMPEPEAPLEPAWQELRPVLDQELNRLPAKYRLPLVLCDLEGRGRKEVSDQLRLPEGTVSSRLARGRQMLARRLDRHGLGLSAGALALVLSQNAVSAGVPAPLVLPTIKAAMHVAAGQAAGLSANVAALTEGVIKAMFLTKLKSALLAALLMGFFGTAVGLLAHRSLAGPAPALPSTLDEGGGRAKPAAREGDRGRRDGPSLTGRVAGVAKDGKGLTLLIPPQARGEEPGKQEVKFTDKTQVSFSGIGPGGAKITAGLNAQVWLADGSPDVAERVHLSGNLSPRKRPEVVGRVEAVSKDGKTLTFVMPSRVRGEDGPSVDVRLTDKTVLLFSFVPKGGTKPTAGYHAMVWLVKGSKDTAAAVSFTGENPRGERGAVPRNADRPGKVVAVAKDGKSFTVEVRPQARGEEPTKEVIKLDDKVKVDYANVGPDGDRPTEGYIAQIYMANGSPDRIERVIFQAPPQEKRTILMGTVAGIAKDGKSITLELPARGRGEDAKTVEVKMGPKTEVIYQGVGPDGAKLTAGYGVQVWLEEGSKDTAEMVVLGTSLGRR